MLCARSGQFVRRLCWHVGLLSSRRGTPTCVALQASSSSFRFLAGGVPIRDIGDAAASHVSGSGLMPGQLAELASAEEIRAVARHPRMASLQIKSQTRVATLRRREVTVDVPLSSFREKLREWSWQESNCHQPMLLFGDDSQEVQRSHEILVEEGFTAVSNAGTRATLVSALKKAPAHLKEE